MQTKCTILLLNPPSPHNRKFMRTFDCSTESKGNYLYQPYDTLLITSSFPADAQVVFIDAIAEKINLAVFLSRISEMNPDFIFYAMGDSLWDDDFSTLLEIKKIHSKSQFYVYGDSFNDLETFNYISHFVDGVIKSPWDLTEDFFYNGNTKGLKIIEDFVVNKGPKSYHPKIPRHELFLHKAYRWPFARHYRYTTIFTNWGCPYLCDYCILSSFPFYQRSVQNIIEELDYIYKLGLKEIYFGDRSFAVQKDMTEELLQQMIINKYNFSWSCYFHPNQFTPSLLKLMKDAGCHTIISGIETKDENLLKKNKRYIKNSNILNMLKFAKEINIDVCGDFIIGLPEQDIKEVKETIEYSLNLNLAYASFNIATPLAGTSIRRMAINQKDITKNEKGFNSLGTGKLISVSQMSINEIKHLKRKASFKFYLRPSYLLGRLFKIRSFEHFLIQFQEAWEMIKK